MMKLSLMLEFFKTVNDEWESPIANKLGRYWFNECVVKVVRASANFVCICIVNGEHYFIRFNHEDERSRDYYQEEIHLLNYLITKNIYVCEPVTSLNGKYIESIYTDLGLVNAVCFKAIPGKQYESDELDDEKIILWGKSLGKLHHQLRNLDIKINRPSYQDVFSYVKNNVSDYKNLSKITEFLQRELNDLPKSSEDFGLIHFDYEADNIVYNDNIYSLDYDDCGYYWYVCDIIYALRDFFVDNKLPLSKETQLFINGYQSETTFNQELLLKSDMFIALHHYYFLGRLSRSVNLQENVEYPEWMNNLIKKLNNKINEIKAYLEALI